MTIVTKDGKVALSEIVSQMSAAKEDPVAKADSQKAKIASWNGPVDQMDLARLIELQDMMQNFVDKHFAKVRFDETRQMTQEELQTLMAENLVADDIKAALDGIRAQTKAMFNRHATATLMAQGMTLEDAANTNYREPVEGTGKAFDKYGCGKKDATINQDRLREALGDKADIYFKDVEVTVTETHLDEDALMRDLLDDPEIRKAVEDSIDMGADKTPMFTIRNVKGKK